MANVSISFHPESGDALYAEFEEGSRDPNVTWFTLHVGGSAVTVFLPKERWHDVFDAVQVAYEKGIGN